MKYGGQFTKEFFGLRAKRFQSGRYNAFSEEINKIALSSSDDKRMQSIDSIETYGYGTSKDLICKEKKLNKIIQQSNTKTFNFHYITKEDIKEHNPSWPEVANHPYRILITGDPGSGKANALINLINNEPDIDKIYIYAKVSYEAKYQLLINKT